MLLLTKTQPPILYVRTIYDHPRFVDRLFRDWYDITQLPKDDLKVTVNFNYCEFPFTIRICQEKSWKFDDFQ